MTAMKQQIKDQLLQKIQAQIEVYEAAFEDARLRSNESEGRNQTRYDTQKAETGYEAEAYAKKVIEFRRIYSVLLNFPWPRDNEKVQIGSLVTLKWNRTGQTGDYLIIAQAGGIDLEDLGIMTISHQAPLAQAILNRQAGEEVRMRMGPQEQHIRIEQIG
jgi:transcription elongation GreA/GreB family factor